MQVNNKYGEMRLVLTEKNDNLQSNPVQTPDRD